MKPTGKYLLCTKDCYDNDSWFIYFDYNTSTSSNWHRSLKDVLASHAVKANLPSTEEICTKYSTNLIYLQPINSLETLPQDFPELFL